MFTESFDVKKWDILRGLDERISDDYADEWQDRQDTSQKQKEYHDREQTKDKGKKSSRIDTLGNDISSETGEYWSFFNNFPNGFHEAMSWLSFGQKITELKEANRWVPEKKIKWFDKIFEDGKNVEVREEAGNITFTFFDEWKNNQTTITLTNFQNFEKKWIDWEVLATPSISMIWDMENLPDPIKKVANKIDWTLNLSEDNAEIFKEVFDSLHQNIMRPKIEEFHGYVKYVTDKTEDLFLDISTGNPNEVDNHDSPRWNNFVDLLIKDYNYDNFTTEDYYDLISRKIALSLCLLLRNSSKVEIKNSIKKTLWYDEEDSWVKQKDTLNKDEKLVEYIPVDEFFVANGDALINLAIDYYKNNQSERSEEIINFLTL